MGLEVSTRFGALVGWLFVTILVLATLHIGVMVCWSTQGCGRVGDLANVAGHMFDLSREGNIPTWFSFAQLLLAAMAARLIAYHARAAGERALPWNAMAAILLYISIDEATDLHFFWGAAISTPEEGAPQDFFAWMLPGVVLVVLIGLGFLGWVLRRPPRLRAHFLVGGAVFVAGGLGFEYVGSRLADATYFNPSYLVASTIEEVLEMLGVLIVVRGLLGELERRGLRVVFGEG